MWRTRVSCCISSGHRQCPANVQPSGRRVKLIPFPSVHFDRLSSDHYDPPTTSADEIRGWFRRQSSLIRRVPFVLDTRRLRGPPRGHLLLNWRPSYYLKLAENLRDVLRRGTYAHSHWGSAFRFIHLHDCCRLRRVNRRSEKYFWLQYGV